MGIPEPPPEPKEQGAPAHAAATDSRARLLHLVSTRWSLRIWYGGVVGFFLLLVLLPTLFVLGYVVAGWASVETVLADPTKSSLILPALWLSFGVALAIAALDLVAGLPIAWLIVRHDFRGKSWFNTLIDSPLAVTTAGLGFRDRKSVV